MNILKLLIVTLSITTIWFEYFQLQTWLKVKMGHRAHQYKKPYDCYTCTNWWLGITVAVLYSTSYVIIFGFNWLALSEVLFFAALNYHVGNAIDHLKYNK